MARIWVMISPGSWLGRKRMSTSMVQRSGTLLKASPPMIRARLIDGRSKRSEDSRLNGSVSMRRKASWALRIALSPSHGVEPWAAVPEICRRSASTPFAWTPMCRSVGSPVSAKSARRPSLTRTSVERLRDVLGLLVGDADEAHAHLVLAGDVLEGAHHGRERALHVVGAAADQPVALDARRELALARGDDVEVAVEDDGRARRRGPASARMTGRPSWSTPSTLSSRDSSQPLTKPAAARRPSPWRCRR